jgi:hypothetical protein
MGQARVRKQTEPTYGIVPKTPSKRGLIISNPIKLDVKNNSVQGHGGLNPSELRFSLLYWDKLARPDSNIFRFGGGDDENFLISAGILACPMIFHQGGNAASVLLDTFISAMNQLEASEPGVWSLSQGEQSLFLENYPDNFSDKSGISVKLIRSIPIPSDDVPLAEILEFKEKRRDELNILHAHINNLSTKISLSNEVPAEMEKTIKDIDRACADLLKVSSEWQQPVHIGDLKASINFNGFKTLGAAGAAWKLIEPYGLPAATAAAVATGVISAIDIKADIGFRSIKRTKTPYHYAWQAHRELV